jgi:hypothetical protein
VRDPCTFFEQRTDEMPESEKRACGFMKGPSNSSIQISPARWWLAISRDVVTKEFRKLAIEHRPPVSCSRTPTFVSPLSHADH